jgi:hypothetical protein
MEHLHAQRGICDRPDGRYRSDTQRDQKIRRCGAIDARTNQALSRRLKLRRGVKASFWIAHTWLYRCPGGFDDDFES